ncbi:MAG TPA: helix-turn-helix domain-containing protein [Gemmatimonadaceae bacterium]|jgi:AcrR family transcriptional regulator
MINRARILDAAARVYAKHGFRGATTRLIAIEAGVNEVTLFRTFGSKAALMHAVLTAQSTQGSTPILPETPVDPVKELTTFVDGILHKLREVRPLLAHAMSEFDERPDAADFARCGRTATQQQLHQYVRRLPALAHTEPADVDTAVTMLSSTIMGDVMGRPMMPDSYPPIEEAAGRYVRAFLRILGVPAVTAAPARLSRTRTA